MGGCVPHGPLVALSTHPHVQTVVSVFWGGGAGRGHHAPLLRSTKQEGNDTALNEEQTHAHLQSANI